MSYRLGPRIVGTSDVLNFGPASAPEPTPEPVARPEVPVDLIGEPPLDPLAFKLAVPAYDPVQTRRLIGIHVVYAVVAPFEAEAAEAARIVREDSRFADPGWFMGADNPDRISVSVPDPTTGGIVDVVYHGPDLHDYRCVQVILEDE